MERSETMPPFQELGLFNDLIGDTSFNERFDTCDIEEIISSDDQSSNLGIWSDLDTDALNTSPDIKVENVSESENIASKNMFCIGNGPGIYVIKKSDYEQYTGDESSGDQFIDKAVMVVDANSVDQSNYLSNARPTPSLSLQPWKGKFDFNVALETLNHQSNKWVFSNSLKKIFLRPFEAVPFEITVSNWINNGYINITPVYTSSEHNSNAVLRCPNHRMADEEKNLPYSEHIVQVDNPDATYRVDESRYSVDIPLGTPAPGQSSKLLYVKCGCWNTCTGGPSRKAFCLLFTLFSSLGEEVGRQVIQLKVCACPNRDKKFQETKYNRVHAGKKGEKKISVQTKRSLSSSGKVSKRVLVHQGGVQGDVENIAVPCEIAADVKRFVNQRMAEIYAKQNDIKLPFPDV